MTISSPPRQAQSVQQRPRRNRGPFVVVALLVVAGVGYWATHRGGKPEHKEPPPVSILAAPAKVQAVPLALTAIGNVQAYNSVLVRALATGEVKQVWFHEGQPVHKGQPLFEIDAGPAQALLQQAEAAYDRDRVQAANAAAEARRYAGLLKQGFVTREQAEQMQTSAASLNATLAADNAAIANAKISLGYTHIVSPIDGVAGALQVNIGNLVKSADQTPMVVINQVSPIYVQFSVPEGSVDDVRRFRTIHPLTVSARPHGMGNAVEGKLTFIDNAVDATTGTLMLKGTFANQDGRLVPGEYVDVTLTLDKQPNALTVPATAVQTGQNGTFVFVVKDDQTVTVRPIKLQRQAGEVAVITEGLKPGEQVVTDGQLQLVEGAKVRLRESLTQPQGAGQGQGEGGQGHGGHR